MLAPSKIPASSNSIGLTSSLGGATNSTGLPHHHHPNTTITTIAAPIFGPTTKNPFTGHSSSQLPSGSTNAHYIPIRQTESPHQTNLIQASQKPPIISNNNHSNSSVNPNNATNSTSSATAAASSATQNAASSSAYATAAFSTNPNSNQQSQQQSQSQSEQAKPNAIPSGVSAAAAAPPASNIPPTIVKDNKIPWYELWRALIRPPNRIQYTPAQLGPMAFIVDNKTIARREDFQVKNARGMLLECSYFEARAVTGKPHPCVLYLHGNSSSRIEGIVLIQYLIPYGISLVLMDFAGCGVSQGEYISLGYFEQQDAMQVLKHVKRTKPITEFGIWGRSMGAATTLMTSLQRAQTTTTTTTNNQKNKNNENNIEEEEENDIRNKIRFIVADSSFMSIRLLCEEIARTEYKIPSLIFKMVFNYIRRKISAKAHFDLDDCDALAAVKSNAKYQFQQQQQTKNSKPEHLLLKLQQQQQQQQQSSHENPPKTTSNSPSVLFLSAVGDTLINPSHSQTLFESYKGTKRILRFEGTHNSRRPRDINLEITTFFFNGFFDAHAMQYLKPFKMIESLPKFTFTPPTVPGQPTTVVIGNNSARGAATSSSQTAQNPSNALNPNQIKQPSSSEGIPLSAPKPPLFVNPNLSERPGIMLSKQIKPKINEHPSEDAQPEEEEDEDEQVVDRNSQNHRKKNDSNRGADPEKESMTSQKQDNEQQNQKGIAINSQEFQQAKQIRNPESSGLAAHPDSMHVEDVNQNQNINRVNENMNHNVVALPNTASIELVNHNKYNHNYNNNNEFAIQNNNNNNINFVVNGNSQLMSGTNPSYVSEGIQYGSSSLSQNRQHPNNYPEQQSQSQQQCSTINQNGTGIQLLQSTLSQNDSIVNTRKQQPPQQHQQQQRNMRDEENQSTNSPNRRNQNNNNFMNEDETIFSCSKADRNDIEQNQIGLSGFFIPPPIQPHDSIFNTAANQTIAAGISRPLSSIVVGADRIGMNSVFNPPVYQLINMPGGNDLSHEYRLATTTTNTGQQGQQVRASSATGPSSQQQGQTINESPSRQLKNNASIKLTPIRSIVDKKQQWNTNAVDASQENPFAFINSTKEYASNQKPYL